MREFCVTLTCQQNISHTKDEDYFHTHATNTELSDFNRAAEVAVGNLAKYLTFQPMFPYL